jgi:hypothetical protein
MSPIQHNVIPQTQTATAKAFPAAADPIRFAAASRVQTALRTSNAAAPQAVMPVHALKNIFKPVMVNIIVGGG